MKTQKHILTIVLFLWTILLLGQPINPNKNCISKFDSISNRSIYIVVDTMPEFPGGKDSLNEFIKKNLRWPTDDGANNVGSVYIAMIIESDGSLTNRKVLKGVSKSFDNEALILIDKMPKWKAGKCGGKAVPVKYYIPIHFISYIRKNAR